MGDAEVDAIMARGREVLSQIPGVRRVITGRAAPEGKPRYRFSWLIEFAHRAVVDSYRDHPLHLDFANRVFRPIAGDRVSIDYVSVDRVAPPVASRVSPHSARG